MTETTLTLHDIADLARVQRSVVSMWRRRRTVRGVDAPFPDPVRRDGGVERFDRDQVVAWLEATRRGNNTEARQDAPALSVPAGADRDDVIVLLCLHALSGEELAGLTASRLADLAARVDPDDELLLREVRALTDHGALQRFVDDLVEGSFGPSDALDRVESGPLRREAAERGLDVRLVELVRAVGHVCRAHLGDEGVALAAHGDGDLAELVAPGFAGLVLDSADPETRGRRRRARLREIELLDGARATVRVLSVVGSEPDAALDAVDDLALSLARSDIGIVLGAASVLCDRLMSGAAERRRAQTLRGGALAIAIRLPRGGWKGAPRQHLALWVLQGERTAPSLYMADLDGLLVDVGDLASDVAAALALTEKRAYRYARRAELAPVLAGTVPVVPRGVRTIQVTTQRSSAHIDAVYSASLVTSRTVRGFDVTVEPAASRLVVRQRSLREMVDAGHLVLKRGNRIDPAHEVAEGTVRVLTADHSLDHVRFDPLDVERKYPRATRTEPGDVVFVEQPRPRARVDQQGGALVASPSRILRLRGDAAIGPHTLAALINELATPGTEWQTWSAPDLPQPESRALDATLRDAARHLVDLRAHEEAVRDLTTNLIQGVAAGALTIATTSTQKAG